MIEGGWHWGRAPFVVLGHGVRGRKTPGQRRAGQGLLLQDQGRVVYDEFYPKHSKPIIDEIGRVLARHCGFTEEEVDFIINYDIKYRMGKAEEEEEA